MRRSLRFWARLVLGLGIVAATLRLFSLPSPGVPLSPATDAVAAAVVDGPSTTLLLPQVAPSSHAAALAADAEGRPLLVWFAGSREGAADVQIYFSRFTSGVWSAPRAVAERQQIQAVGGRYLRKLGNPLLALDGEGRLHLWFVSVSIGGWAGASLNHQSSADGGITWSPPRRLVTAPFLNVSTLVRNSPLLLQGGGFALPVYHEFISKHGEWLLLAADGETVLDKARMPAARPLLQPAVAPTSEGLLAVLRDAGPGPGALRTARSSDGGSRWKEGAALAIANPNSAAAMIRLADGRLLLACNPIAQNRNKLSLWLSGDAGASWRESRVVESSPSGREEYSYPALLQGGDGQVHLVYTWNRQTIKHVRLPLGVLAAGAPS